MMISLKNKLKSTSGASLVISMMFFLVAMMVGTVCLTAAYNNAGRATHEQDLLQQNYAVESAINLIKQDMARTETYTSKTVEGKDEVYTEEYSAEFILTPLPDETEKINPKNITEYAVEISDNNRESEGVPICGKLLYQVLTKESDSLAEYVPRLIQGVQGDLTLKVDDSGDVTFGNSLDVTGTYTLGTEIYGTSTVDALNFDLVVSVWSNNNGVKSSMTTVTFPAQVRTRNIYNSDDETVTEKLIVTWGSPQVG